MQVELWPIDRVRPYERNPRLNDAAVDAVARSLKEFGWRQPLVVDADGVLIVGHTRWKAAKSLGWTEVPVHVATNLSPEQVKAYRIADNQTATIATWDTDLLPLELAALSEMDFNLDLLGFSAEELARLTAPPATEGLVDPDDIPAPPDAATTQSGDLWILGNHRLLCGDSSLPADVDRLLEGASIHLVNTDPPYGVNVEPRSNNAIAAGHSGFGKFIAAENAKRQGGRKQKLQDHQKEFDLARHPGKSRPTHKKMRPKDRPLANDFVSGADFDDLLALWFGNIARVLAPGGAFYIWGGFANWANYCQVLAAHGLYFSQGITWVKDHPVLGRKDFMNDCEYAWYGWKEGAGHKFYGPTNARNVWHVKKVNPQSMVHLTEKPTELARRAIEYSSVPGEHVLDLFGGSGSTLIACEQTGRKAFLMELDGLYCDVIVERWQKFTGQSARRITAQEVAA